MNGDKKTKLVVDLLMKQLTRMPYHERQEMLDILFAESPKLYQAVKRRSTQIAVDLPDPTPAEPDGPVFHCSCCAAQLTEPGGLIFSPPLPGADPLNRVCSVVKHHVCKACYTKKFAYDETEQQDKDERTAFWLKWTLGAFVMGCVVGGAGILACVTTPH